MEPAIISPAAFKLFGFIPMWFFGILIPVVGIAFFTYIIARRIEPLFRANPEHRFDNILKRLFNTYSYPHHKMPRYLLSSFIHISILISFIIISIHWVALVLRGVSDSFLFSSGCCSFLNNTYQILTDIAFTYVLLIAVFAIVRRTIFKPARYNVPSKYGKSHTKGTVLGLSLISFLMICAMFFEGTLAGSQIQKGLETQILVPMTGTWIIAKTLSSASFASLQNIHLISYYLHDLVFFFSLCLLPFGRFFHLITAPANVLFKGLEKGKIKPVKYGISEDQLDSLESFGVKKFEDFTWKHILDFYSCADCGRCSDNCPANAVGRPLSPRFFSIKGRDYIFNNYPIFKDKICEDKPLIGNIYEESEIWSCTTCGACEEECPVGNEYINKIVDLRRGMVDEGMVPQSLQKPLKALEKRGNPWGKMEKKRADWAKDKEFSAECKVKLFEKGETAKYLYFVDSISSYDDRMQDIAKSTARVLTAAQVDFGILGKKEKDSGNEVKRFGEEMLFIDLKNQNIDAILDSGVERIVTADPHAYNALKNDYTDIPPVEHISEVIVKEIQSGKIQFKSITDQTKVYTYHDPCYLGRHNSLYEEPREVLDSIPGLTRVDMLKSGDRSFCCGGGGLMLFYEPEEEERMGVLRVKMAAQAGANVIVTACPFCLVNIEDAIKVAGMEGKMEAIDLCELVSQHIV